MGLEADREASVTLSADDLPLSPSVMVAVGLEGPLLDEGLYVEIGGSQDFEEVNVKLFWNDPMTFRKAIRFNWEWASLPP